MRLYDRHPRPLQTGASRRRPGSGPAALGILLAAALGAACTATAPQTVEGADVADRPASAPALPGAAPTAEHPRGSTPSAGESAAAEPLGAAPADFGEPTPAGPRPSPVGEDGWDASRGVEREPTPTGPRQHPVGAEGPDAAWSPEAARAGHTGGGVGGPPPGRRNDATTATTPPDAVEMLPGPPVPDGPVTLASSRRDADPPADVAAAILDAYTAFWDSYWVAATHPVNPGHPGISEHSAEPLRSRAVGVLRGRAAEGIALRLPADHGAGRVIHIEGWDTHSAEVLDCFVDTAVLYEVSTGRVRNDEQATVVHLALMRRERGAWRVVEIFEQETHTGRTDGCIMQASRNATPAPTEGPPLSQAAPEGGGAGGAPPSPS